MSRDKYQKLLQDAAKARGVPFNVLDRMAMAESGYNPRAVSPKGAQGMFQIMPATGRELGLKDPFDPAQSTDAGARYLRQLYDQTGDWQKATAAYNFGIGNIKAGKPLPRETRDYQRRIWGENPNTNVEKDMNNRERIGKGLDLAGGISPEEFQTAANAVAPNDTKAYAGARYSPKKTSKLDLAMGAGSGVLAAIAALLGNDKPREGFSPVSAGGHGAAPITGGQSYNAGPLQKQGALGVSPYHSTAIASLLRG